MSKTKAKRKQQAQQQNGNAAKRIKPSHDDNHNNSDNSTPFEPKQLTSLISPEELEITIDTLHALAAYPSLTKAKPAKDLRAAVFAFRNACTTGQAAASIADAASSSLTARISAALADANYVDARVLLAEMRVRGHMPKLGALCRWVRDLDAISGLAEQRGDVQDEITTRTDAQVRTLEVLDAILRVTGPVDYSPLPPTATIGPMVVRETWDLRGTSSPTERVYDSVLDGSLQASVSATTLAKFRILETTPGALRKPPNHHPAILHASQDDTIELAPSSSSSSPTPPPTTTHHTHPTVPNLHLLRDVLTPGECKQIIAVAERIGFTPDAPIRADGEEAGGSVLAHNFYWIADEAFCRGVWERVAPFVPASVGGRTVRGLNRRMRVYRYVPGAEYRAHIDGAWPPSGISPEDKYIYDASPPDAKQSSLFTFLIYLNDEFEGGETTYFLPAARQGTLNAYSIRPIQGSVAMFPHGETVGSLLHEGTGVKRGDRPSAKYVIRTDVEYDVEPAGV